jgi:hypothetical protein
MNRYMHVSNNRRAEPLLIGFLVFAAGVGLILPFGGHPAQISDYYWDRAVPIAIFLVILVGWWFRKNLIGRTLRGRFGGLMEIGPIVAWFYGLFGATILAVMLLHFVAYALNRVEGLSYTAIYRVTGKYEYRGKSNCNGLILTKEDAPSDQFKVCVSAPQHAATNIGDKMLINGLRSRYVNQMLSFKKIPDRDKTAPVD